MSDWLDRLKRRSRPTELQGLIGNPDEAYVSAADLRSAIAEIERLREWRREATVALEQSAQRLEQVDAYRDRASSFLPQCKAAIEHIKSVLARAALSMEDKTND